MDTLETLIKMLLTFLGFIVAILLMYLAQMLGFDILFYPILVVLGFYCNYIRKKPMFENSLKDNLKIQKKRLKKSANNFFDKFLGEKDTQKSNDDDFYNRFN